MDYSFVGYLNLNFYCENKFGSVYDNFIARMAGCSSCFDRQLMIWLKLSEYFMKTTNYRFDTITDQFVVSHMTLAWLIAMNTFTFSCLQGNAGPAGSKGALGAKGAKVTLTLFLLFLQHYILHLQSTSTSLQSYIRSYTGWNWWHRQWRKWWKGWRKCKLSKT